MPSEQKGQHDPKKPQDMGSPLEFPKRCLKQHVVIHGENGEIMISHQVLGVSWCENLQPLAAFGADSEWSNCVWVGATLSQGLFISFRG